MVFLMQIYVDHVFISDRRRAVIGPVCRYSDQLPISIRYGHADWALGFRDSRKCMLLCVLEGFS